MVGSFPCYGSVILFSRFLYVGKSDAVETGDLLDCLVVFHIQKGVYDGAAGVKTVVQFLQRLLQLRQVLFQLGVLIFGDFLRKLHDDGDGIFHIVLHTADSGLDAPFFLKILLHAFQLFLQNGPAVLEVAVQTGGQKKQEAESKKQIYRSFPRTVPVRKDLFFSILERRIAQNDQDAFENGGRCFPVGEAIVILLQNLRLI